MVENNVEQINKVHPNEALFGGEKPFPLIPACEHFAGRRMAHVLWF